MSRAANRRSGRRQFLLIAAAFLGPLIIAAWLYFGGESVQPSARTNHGALLEPILNLRDALPESPLHEFNAQTWLLVYAHADACGDACRTALYTSRQSRRMLGREMDRLTRVFLHGASVPDTVFLAAEQRDLITIEDSSLDGLLDQKRPDGLPEGGFFLIDPLGNLVMYFRPDMDPYDMVDDIERLLKLSRIG